MASCKNSNAVKFTRDDLEIGHVVELRNGEFRMVMPVGTSGSLILAGGLDTKWSYLTCWDDDLDARSQRFVNGAWPSHEAYIHAKEFDIMAVYGFVQGSVNYNRVGDLSRDNRPVLWTRIKPKRMTVKEIEEELGYRVEIISDNED